MQLLLPCSVKQSIQAMDICRRSRRSGISSTSNGIYDLPSQHSAGSNHLTSTGNAASAVASSNRLVMANLPTDNSNIAALAFNAAINNHVSLFVENQSSIQSANCIRKFFEFTTTYCNVFYNVLRSWLVKKSIILEILSNIMNSSLA
jgi:hypothetical protein